MIEYIKAQKETDDAIINGVFDADELYRFSNSEIRWVENKTKLYPTRHIKKGEVYQIEFGKNFAPEMSYEHRGLVIGVKNKLLHVLPIYSYNPKKHLDVYHPNDFPNTKSDMYLLKKSEFTWLKHDSILKLNDLRTVSINRVLYQHKGGYIKPASKTYKIIESLVIKKYFAEFYHEFEEDKKTIEKIKEENKSLENKVKELEEKAKILEEKIDVLEKGQGI